MPAAGDLLVPEPPRQVQARHGGAQEGRGEDLAGGAGPARPQPRAEAAPAPRPGPGPPRPPARPQLPAPARAGSAAPRAPRPRAPPAPHPPEPGAAPAAGLASLAPAPLPALSILQPANQSGGLGLISQWEAASPDRDAEPRVVLVTVICQQFRTF